MTVCVACHCRAWELPRREYGDASGYAPQSRPHIPFEGTSTSRADYTPKQLECPQYYAGSTGGAPQYAGVPETRDFTSEARAAHGWKEPESVCPAALLPPAPPASAQCVTCSPVALISFGGVGVD